MKDEYDIDKNYKALGLLMDKVDANLSIVQFLIEYRFKKYPVCKTFKKTGVGFFKDSDLKF